MSINDYHYGLADAKVAVWNGVESYGTAVDVLSVQMFGLNLQTESGQLEGDDIITDVHAKIQAAEVSLRFGFNDLAVIEVLTGVTLDESDYNESMVFARDNMPYFALCGKAVGTNLGGDIQIFIPKVKLLEAFSFRLEKGNYIIPEVSGKAVYESATYGIAKLIQNATAQSVTIPPTGATS